MDLTLLNRLLRLIVDHNIADYMTAKNNVVIAQGYGPHQQLRPGADSSLPPLSSSTTAWCWTLLLLGLTRASELAGAPAAPNEFLSFRDVRVETPAPHPSLPALCEQGTCCSALSADEARDLIQRYPTEHPDPNENIVGYNNKKRWPRRRAACSR